VPVREARTLERLFRERSFSFEAKIYAGQGHGFTGDDRRDAHRRALAFLDKHIKDASAVPQTVPTVADRVPVPGPAGGGPPAR
jgi:carboxymethylenebutenolidase